MTIAIPVIKVAQLMSTFVELAAEWNAHYAELQGDLDAPACPRCGYEMRVWSGLWGVEGDEPVWRCKRRWKEDSRLMICPGSLEFEDEI